MKAFVYWVCLLALTSATFAAEPPARFAPPMSWSFPSPEKLQLSDHPDGGPGGRAWCEVTYTPGAAANIRPDRPFALEPGSWLKVQVKGNGSEDVLSLYLFGGEGHRAYNIPLSDTSWHEAVFDISEDFGENHWRWDTPVHLDLGAIRELKLFAHPNASTGAAPVGLGAITFAAPAKSDRPAVMLATCGDTRGDPDRNWRILPHLRAAGFETQLRQIYAVGSATYLDTDQVARFNAVILLDLPPAEKGGYPKHFDRVAEVLHQYVEAGGGLYFAAIPAGWNNILPTMNAFLQPWGARCFDEQVVDPDNMVQSDAWFQKYPFCWTDNVAPHPVTAGVKGTWYPGKAWRADGILTTVGFTTDISWQVLLRGKETARTVQAKGNELVTEPAASIPSAPPIFAVRQVGQGRVGLLPIYPSFLTGGCDHPSWASMVWDGGAKGLTSDMKTLFLNAVRWLAEPSHQAGTLGGYVEPKEKPDWRQTYEQPIPIDWAKLQFAQPNHQDYLMLVGMASDLTDGSASPPEMVAAAKAAGYQVGVFAEAVEKLDAAKWKRLCDACAAGSDEGFLAIPGFRYRDPQGNSFLLFGTFDWPDADWHGRCFNADGRVIDTYALYAKVSGWRHVAIWSLNTKANPILQQRHYSCVAVFSYDGDKLVDDSYDDYLLLEENCYYPIPLAVHLVRSTAEVAGATAGWQTRLWARDLKHAQEQLDGGKAGESYFWNPKPTYLSSGPRLLDWQELNMNSWRADAPGTDLWKFRLALADQAPLSEVRIMDGTHLWRRFLPNQPAFSLDQVGHHGKQQQFTLRAKDANGGELISSHLKTHTMTHVFFICGDRQNSLGEGSWGYQPWPAQYGTAPDVDIYDLFPPHWDGGAPGFGSFCVATVRGAKDVDVGGEDNLGMLAYDKATLMSSRDCTITREVGAGKFRDRHDWGDCKPTPWLAPREHITSEVTRWHYRVPQDAVGFMVVEGKVTALSDLATAPGAPVGLYSLSDNGSKNGELGYFAYTAPDGRHLVRATPDGLPYYTADGVARLGDYFSTFPRKLGAPVLFPLSPVTYHLHADPRLFGTTFSAPVPEGRISRGQRWDYRFLFGCYTSQPGELNETPERIREGYGLTGEPAYTCQVTAGELLSRVYELRLKAADGAAGVELGQAALPGALPIAVEGLNDRWTAVISDGDKVRFIGVLDGVGYAITDLRDGAKTLFVGHPVTCGDPRLHLELTDWTGGVATVEVHNPTDEAVSTWVATSAQAGFMNAARQDVQVAAGTSAVVRLQ